MKSKRQKLMVLVHSELFVRNYFRTDALKEIEREYDCLFAYSADLKDPSPVLESKGEAVQYRPDHQSIKRQMKFYKLMTWRFRKKSSTFAFRVKRSYQPTVKLKMPPYLHPLANLRWLKSFLGVQYRLLRARILGSKPLYALQFKNFLRKMVPNQELAHIANQFRPDLIIIPTSAYDPEANTMMIMGREQNIPTLCLVDNWDNLSSKSTMWITPDHMGVWGQQSAEHAHRIQDYEKSKITLMGTPRFDGYFQDRHRDIESFFDHPYLLFLGTSLAFDEASALEYLDDVFRRHTSLFGHVKIVYRPHPWRMGKDTILDKDLKHVIIDPQMYEQYAKQSSNITFQPALDYYPSLLKNAEMVVGGLTSMLIESTIFGKRYIGLAYDDGVNVTNQRDVFKNTEHLWGIEKIERLDICDELDDLEQLIVKRWSDREVDIKSADRDREYFLHHDGQAYKTRLKQLVKKLVSGSSGD